MDEQRAVNNGQAVGFPVVIRTSYAYIISKCRLTLSPNSPPPFVPTLWKKKVEFRLEKKVNNNISQ